LPVTEYALLVASLLTNGTGAPWKLRRRGE